MSKTLLDYLNNPDNSEEILKKMDERLSSKEFWEEDERRYQEVMNQIEEEHQGIKMSQEKFNTPFCI